MTIPRHIFDAMIEQARNESPCECCGFLAGRGDAITHLFPLINSARAPETRFESSPESTFAANKAMRRLGIEPLAVYHSHPASPAVPSAADREWNYDASVATIIVSLTTDPPTVLAWRLVGAEFKSLECEIRDDNR